MQLGDYVFICAAYWFMCSCSGSCVVLCLTNSSVSDGLHKHNVNWGERGQTADRQVFILLFHCSFNFYFYLRFYFIEIDAI